MKQQILCTRIVYLIFVARYTTIGKCFLLYSTTKTRTRSSYNSSVQSNKYCFKYVGKRQHFMSIESNDNTDEENGIRNKAQESQVSASATASDDSETTVTLAGGASLIFAMARRMLIWDDSNLNNSEVGSTENASPQEISQPQQRDTKRSLPRWHPHAGISDSNPTFRSTSPKMNSFGYSAAIRRNSRKRSSSLQRYALRIYFERFKDSGLPKSIVHYEGALVACSKLGLWQDALEVLHDVDAIMKEGSNRYGIVVNEGMIFSFLKACVRGSKRKPLSMKEKRKSLDIAKDFLNSIEEKYNIPLSPKHLISLASAYQRLKLYDESEILLRTSLSLTNNSNNNTKRYPINIDRIKKSDRVKEIGSTNNDELKASSYSLLVKQSVEKEDWENAVLNLKEMVDDDVYLKF